jgi:hypothetical protein
LDFWTKEDRVGDALHQHSTDGSQASNAGKGFWSIEVKACQAFAYRSIEKPKAGD